MKKREYHPFFTVIICTYNRADIINRALDSLIKQEYPCWEGIVVDDGSTDQTEKIVAPYLKSEYAFRYIKKTHSGLAASRNTGISASQGKYTTFLDTDDTYAPEHLRLRHDFLKSRPDIDLLHSNVTIIGDPYLPDKNNPNHKIHINDCIVGGTFFIKRTSILPQNLFRDGYSDDSRFLEKMKADGKNIQKTDAPTYIYYRNRADSITNQAGEP